VPYKRILASHIRHRVLADRLRLLASAPTSTLTHARWRKVMEHDLDGLQDALLKQFADEERGGYMHGIVSSDPGLSMQVDELFAQHAVMRAALETIAGTIRDNANIDQLRPRLNDFLAMLATHESNETEMIQEALQRDTGAGD